MKTKLHFESNFKRLLILFLITQVIYSRGQVVNLFSETFSSNSFTANGWIFPNGVGLWRVGSSNTPSGGVAPNAFFNWGPVLNNYNIPLVSNTINATSVTGPVTLDYLLLLNNYSTATLEEFKVEYKTIGSTTWSLLAAYSNTLLALQEWSVSSMPLPGVAGTNFQIRFTAFGFNSFNIVRWSLDNIFVNGVVCPATLPSLTITGNTNLCSNIPTTLTASGGGLSYTWTPGGIVSPSIVLSPTSTTSYALISSIPGCTASPVSSVVSINVTPNTTTLSVASSSSVICSGNSATLSASGSSTYTWSPNMNGSTLVVSPLVTTIYTVVSTNSSNCNNSQTIQVNVNPTPTVSVFSSTTSVCYGSSANLIASASGSVNYTWSDNSLGSVVSVTPNTTSVYTVTALSTQSCAGTNTILLTVLPPVLASASSPSVCSGGNVTLTANNVQTYTWSPNIVSSSVIVSPTISTSYTVNATNSVGCLSSQTISLTVFQNPTVNIQSLTNTICLGESTTLTAIGAHTYTWNTGGTGAILPVTGNNNTSYTVTGTSLDGCTGTNNIAVFNLTVHPLPLMNITAPSTLICENSTTSLTVLGAISYSWDSGSTSSVIAVTPSVNTIYSVTGTSSMGCLNSLAFQVNVKPNPTISIVSTASICNGSTAVLIANGASSYVWSDSSTLNAVYVSPTVTTTYSVIGTTNGCSTTQTIEVTVFTSSVNITPSSTVICEGINLVLGCNGASSYTWNTGAQSNSITIMPTTTPSVYTVFTIDSNNCKDTVDVNIVANPNPSVGITNSKALICVGEEVNLQAKGANSYTWSNGSTGPNTFVSPTVSTNYTVTGEDNNGCSNKAITTISVDVCQNIRDLSYLNKVVEVYPNPSSTKIKINLYENTLNPTIEIYDILGNLILKTTANSESTELDIHDLAQGIYYLKVLLDTKYHTVELIKVND
jgi:hypothetical protein